ncbi:glycine betaine ABC transporter substrate-binding protein [Roseisolibacter sp. H3M3-2]|uniref:glycine betaine ABC transporter substrate-binding protein n=1 Tax=Roseisolibacter sp. H3M3-2 TaxID=3031323 RepID=UPI0023D99D5C|nr:glycine betaine ABC transporter substrate-binding protein [Roseisolibacter sp. H3M3-2]MDF1502280.1 glycine betaine ABC transporter substrate-binding protein [Roseisolibacter sp. H3M3-2]
MMRHAVAVLAVGLLSLLGSGPVRAQDAAASRAVVVASKPFGESFILAEMFAQLLEARGIPVARKPGLGSTEILVGALRQGAVDVYPEYTGTGLLAILHDTLPHATLGVPRRVYAHVDSAFRARWGMRWLPPLGFENTFAVAVRRETAERYGLRTLSDLARQSARLTAGFTPDFIERQDGLAGLVAAYGPGISPRAIRPLLPALKYQALAGGSVDVVDGFSTDGLLARYGLVVLEDDRRFFPPYEAAALLGPRAAQRGDVVSALALLSGRLDVETMRALNRRVEVDGEDARAVAASALGALGLRSAGEATTTASAPAAAGQSFGAYLWGRRAALARLTLRHLALVALALAAATLVAVPLGLALERARRAAGPALGALGVLQTIPSIALLAFMVPLLGIGTVPALVALWLYALFPIARGTYTGVRDADPAAVEAAEALGMTPAQRLRLVRLPLAAPVIMAGVRTAAVITVGAATLAAFIGAGGLGEPIVTGLALADTHLVLSGALPAAALALLVDGALSLVERRIAPAHLRRRRGRESTSPVRTQEL